MSDASSCAILFWLNYTPTRAMFGRGPLVTFGPPDQAASQPIDPAASQPVGRPGA